MTAEISGGNDLDNMFFPIITEANALIGTEGPRTAQRIEDLTRMATEIFVGKSVKVSCLDPEKVDRQHHGPITAYRSGFNDQRDWVDHYRSVIERPNAMFLFRHPYSARGTIEDIDFERPAMQIKPRIWSPYRAHDGFFKVSLLDRLGNPKVKVELS